MKTNFTKMFLTLAVALCTVTAFAAVTPLKEGSRLTLTGSAANDEVQATDLSSISGPIDTVVIEGTIVKLNDNVFASYSVKRVYLMGSSIVNLGTGVFGTETPSVVALSTLNYTAATGWEGFNILEGYATLDFNLIVAPTSGNGTASILEDQPLYALGDWITLVATPTDPSTPGDPPAYQFVKWANNDDSKSSMQAQNLFTVKIDDAANDFDWTATIKKIPQTSEFTVVKANADWDGFQQGIDPVQNNELTIPIGNLGAITVAKYKGVDSKYDNKNAPINAGTYKIEINVAGGDDYVSVTNLPVGGEYTIDSLALDIDNHLLFTPTSVAWDDESKKDGVKIIENTLSSVISSGLADLNEAVVFYEVAGNYTTDVPLDAGTYKIKITLPGGTGYKAVPDGAVTGEFTATYNILPVTPPLAASDFKLDPKSVDYTGQVIDVKDYITCTSEKVKEGIKGATITVNGAPTTATTSDVGTYAITIDVAAGPGYNATTSSLSLGDFRIALTPDTTMLDFDRALIAKLKDSTIKWDGKPHGIGDVGPLSTVILTTTDIGKITVKYNGDPGIPVNAGEYTITADIDDNGKVYKAKVLTLGTLKIGGTKISVGDLDVSSTEVNYDGEVHRVTVNAKPGKTMGKITVKYDGDEDKKPIEPGEYAVTVDIAAGGPYEAAKDLRVGTLTINQPTNPPTITRQVELPPVPAGVTLSKQVGKIRLRAAAISRSPSWAPKRNRM
jgi:hypothetical protein